MKLLKEGTIKEAVFLCPVCDKEVIDNPYYGKKRKQCKECKKKKSDYYKNNKIEYHKEYYRNNKEKVYKYKKKDRGYITMKNGVACAERLYVIWHGMKARCYNKNNESYHRYGGRGIKICNEWLKSYLSFKIWSLNNGYSDNLTIDRKDNDGNYSPQNCRWVTNKFNSLNRPMIKLTYAKAEEIRRIKNEQTITNKKLGEMFNVSANQISNIIHNRSWKSP